MASWRPHGPTTARGPYCPWPAPRPPSTPYRGCARRVGSGIPAPGYAEHARAWRAAGHVLIPFDPRQGPPDDLDVILVIQPNNSTGHVHTPGRLLAWHRRLAERGGWLVVDEAFIDATPALSLAARGPLQGLVVLRSLGKFFGLAGARVGFVLAHEDLLQRLSDFLGPRAVSGPSREVARLALEDHDWQAVTRVRLVAEADRLAGLLTRRGLAPSGGTALFQWVRTDRAADIHTALASRGILVRWLNEPDSLRFGLPGFEAEWQRLEQALAGINK